MSLRYTYLNVLLGSLRAEMLNYIGTEKNNGNLSIIPVYLHIYVHNIYIFIYYI